VADVSHELRTPLSTLKSYLETLLDGAAEDPQVRQRFLKILSAETDRMVTMVKDLLTLSQMDAEKVDWQRSAVNLEALAREAVDNLEQKFGSKLPAIKFNFTSGEIMAYVDRDQVSRVFTNLLNNAARFTTEDGEIVIGAKPDDSFVVVSIRDTGIGIPESELPRLFERFYRVEKTRSRDFGGTGLGLSIARKIVEGHGGSIWVESTSGSGTSVYFSLPGYRLDEVNER
jgi:two-component system, OmpR family, sensor histidine kinase VicK